MKFCTKCGKELCDEAAVCTGCGCPCTNSNAVANQNDEGGFGWGLIGFCVPIAGLILYLLWKDQYPKRSKSAGKGALISVIASVVFYIIYFILIFVLMGIGRSI